MSSELAESIPFHFILHQAHAVNAQWERPSASPILLGNLMAFDIVLQVCTPTHVNITFFCLTLPVVQYFNKQELNIRHLVLLPSSGEGCQFSWIRQKEVMSSHWNISSCRTGLYTYPHLRTGQDPARCNVALLFVRTPDGGQSPRNH
jgi:hypothetical protein